MSKYYINFPDDIARQLRQVSDDEIIELLTQLAEKKASSDELAAYESESDIMDDDNLSKKEKIRLKLKARRRDDISTR